jgi:CRISPR-associated protein Cas1
MPIIQHLVVAEYGRHIGKHQERIEVTDLKTGERIVEAPLLHLESVLVGSRGISITADAIAACTERGIPINFLDGSGKAYASLYSAGLIATVITRRAQIEAYGDARGWAAAKGFCFGKLRNQANLVRYMAKYRKETDPEAFEELRRLADEVDDHAAAVRALSADRVDAARGELLSAEGRGAQRYWAAVKLLLKQDLDWPGRRRQGATDPVNSTLNYGYGILYGQVERALVLAGLDPYAGFLHVDRPGKPSLVLDLVEEFRAVAVDRAMLSLVNKGPAPVVTEEGWLDDSSRKEVAARVLERLDGPVRHKGKQSSLRSVIQAQARRLALFLRKDEAEYEPFIAGW